VLAETEPSVGHVDTFAALLVDEAVDVGDGWILVMHGVIQIHGSCRGGPAGILARTVLAAQNELLRDVEDNGQEFSQLSQCRRADVAE
jgi:hypothetical protein